LYCLDLTSFPTRRSSDLIVVVASEGYPGDALTGRAISGLDAAASVSGVHLVHAATQRDATEGWIATGGRVLGVVARGANFSQARDRKSRRLNARLVEISY